MHLLLIDDKKVVLDIYGRALSHFGITVESFTNPAEAVARYSKLVDLVVTDYQMPEMNGHQVAEAIRATNKDAKILLITASDVSGDGFTGVMRKPIIISEFIQKVLDCCKK